MSKDLYEGDLHKKDINENDNVIQIMARDKKAVELFIQDLSLKNLIFYLLLSDKWHYLNKS